MRRAEILRWIEKLEETFGPARPAVDPAPLLERYRQNDYAGMLSHIAKSIQLEAKLRIGYVNSGGPDAPLWVNLPVPMPYYRSPQFRSFQFTVFVRKTAIHSFSFKLLVGAMAHELSHILLDAVGHPLRRQEEAVDMTAMLFGFGNYFLIETEESIERGGYLSVEEIKFARASLGAY